MDDEDELRIRELVRTYTFLNDPRARQLTTRFLAVTLTMGALFALYAFTAEDIAPAATGSEQAAATAEAWPRSMCLDRGAFAAWEADHPHYRIQDVELQDDGRTLCFAYSPTAPMA